MKAVLTCDAVFDVLTCAPFPSGTSDDQVVESHLAVCHDCRQLAEALRPAVGLFHEALSDDVDEELPAYRGDLSPIVCGIDQSRGSVASQSPAPLPTRTKPQARAQSWFGIAACLAVVLAVTFAIVASRSRLAGNEPVVVFSIEDRDATLLVALDLPVNCKTPVTAHLAASSFDCCTKCHTAESRVSSSRRAILKSSVACVACHDWLAEKVSQSLSFFFVPEEHDRRVGPERMLVAALATPQRVGELAAETITGRFSHGSFVTQSSMKIGLEGVTIAIRQLGYKATVFENTRDERIPWTSSRPIAGSSSQHLLLAAGTCLVPEAVTNLLPKRNLGRRSSDWALARSGCVTKVA